MDPLRKEPKGRCAERGKANPEGGRPELALVGVAGLPGLLEVRLAIVGKVDDAREVAEHLESGQTGARGRERHGREDAQASPEEPLGEKSHGSILLHLPDRLHSAGD